MLGVKLNNGVRLGNKINENVLRMGNKIKSLKMKMYIPDVDVNNIPTKKSDLERNN